MSAEPRRSTCAGSYETRYTFDSGLVGRTETAQARGQPNALPSRSLKARLTAAGQASYSKLVAAPTFEASHLSNAAWLSTIRKPCAIFEWPLPQSCAQLI